MTTSTTAKTTTKTTQSKPEKTKPVTPEQPAPTVRILKEGTCPSLTGASTLTYHIGYDAELKFRVWENTGSGLFGREWIDWRRIEPVIKAPKLTGGTLRNLFQGKSRNTPGFLLAVLKAEGLVKAAEGGVHTGADPAPFLKAMEALIASDTDIQVPIVAKGKKDSR
jgi:hypothetical protein